MQTHAGTATAPVADKQYPVRIAVEREYVVANPLQRHALVIETHIGHWPIAQGHETYHRQRGFLSILYGTYVS